MLSSRGNAALTAPRARGWLLLTLLAAAVVTVIALIGARDEPARPASGAREAATGTSGAAENAARTVGGTDLRSRVGDRLTLQVPARDLMNDVAFWAGEDDTRILVVMARDNRTGAERQQGLPAAHGIPTAEGPAAATLTGVVERVPRAEHMYSWGLTEADRAALARAGAYLRVESVHLHGMTAEPSQP